MNERRQTGPQRLRIRASSAAESRLRSGHPWLFDESIREQNREGALGELAVIYDRHDRFLAFGLYDPNSPIRVRILHRGKPQTVDAAWWTKRLRECMARREGLFDAQTTGYRIIHGESDGWPGLVLDRYSSAWVLKLYTAAWFPRLRELEELLRQTVLSPGGCLILRLSRNIQDVARTHFQYTEGTFPQPEGAAASNPAAECRQRFLETGLCFEADLVHGQKTGFFLDQRENRRRVEALSAGRVVLNTFSFSGGFSLYAARGGARAATDLDLSEHALANARRNFALNEATPAIARCRHETVQADAFVWLERNRERRFDLVVLDPPSLARREVERSGAIQAYGRLATNGLRALRPGGILVAASCSAHVSRVEFYEAIQLAARKVNRPFSEIERTGHPADHPVAFAEAEYLKCIYLRLT